ncbi:hypothetical protein [Methanobacterium sp.]|uniref:hypothetical protein n=1 Tax=Methanobacterium sp. TaxID=2164 RepID=UPI003D65B7E1
MVSNEEISRRLRNKKEGKDINHYLVCDSCGGYYELKPGESPKDFNLDCECGGQLITSPSNNLYSHEDEYVNSEEEYKNYDSIILIGYISLLVCPIALIISLYLLTRGNEKAKKHGIIILIIAVVIIFIAMFLLPSLLIYNSYFGSDHGLSSSADVVPVRSSINDTVAHR